MILWSIILVIIAYLVIGYFFHLIIFPETKPDPNTYIKPGDILNTEKGGNTIKILSRENDQVRVEMTFEPGAEGPPAHIHTGWDELYKVVSGELTFLYEGERKKLEEGEELSIPKGVPHKPTNSSDKPAVCESIMPAQFAIYLDQVYKFMDEDEKNTTPPRMIFQMAVLNQYFDSYLAEGPPVWIQKTLNFLLRPLARLLGYKSFYEKFRIR